MAQICIVKPIDVHFDPFGLPKVPLQISLAHLVGEVFQALYELAKCLPKLSAQVCINER